LKIEKGSLKFDSISDISSYNFKNLLKNNSSDEVIDFLKNLNLTTGCLGIEYYTSENIPGSLLYEESLTPKSLEKEFGIPQKTIETKAKDTNTIVALKNLTSKFGKPSKYYCIIHIDVDEMGKWMSGVKHDAYKKEFTIDIQRKLSKNLCKLSDEITKKINCWGGYTIYAGGDDILALGPLEGALNIVSEIRSSFENYNKPFPSVSASLTIVHHLEHLQIAIEDAREALNLAKESFDRDSIIIRLRNHSGHIFTCGYKWNLKGDKDFIDLLYQLVDLMKIKGKDGLSPRFVFDILDVLPAFYENRKKWYFHNDMFVSEIKRLLLKHIGKNNDVLQSKTTLLPCLLSIIGDPKSDTQNELRQFKEKSKYNGQDNLQSFLKIAAFLAKEYREILGKEDK